MTEYTVLSVGVLVVATALNYKYNPIFRKSKIVGVALVLVIVAQLIADNVTVWRGFWTFNDAVTLGVRIPFMPVENLFFGLALFLFTILFWERQRSELPPSRSVKRRTPS